MDLPSIHTTDVKDKTVFVRASLDVPIENGVITDDTRLQSLLKTLYLLKEKNARRIIIAGHMGRPNGDYVPELSTKNIIEWFKEKLQEDVYFIPFMHGDALHECPAHFDDSHHQFFLLENLRFWAGEEENDPEFIESLSCICEVYVNESFDTSHREHSSIVGLAQKHPSCFGENFIEEYTHLSRARHDPRRPVVALLSGLKKDKLDYLEPFLKFSDKVLISGRLPDYMDEDYEHEKVIIAKLNPDKEDITLHSIEKFEAEISHAETIIVSGPMGKFEEEGHRLGTDRVFAAVASNSNAYRIAGGGDTNAAIDLLGIRDHFDWVSTAGGAMLDFLANGTLVGIESVINK